MTAFIQTAFAATYTRYPPYDVGFSGGGKVEQGGAANYGHSIHLSNGTAKLYVIADAAFIGGAMAEAWGYAGISWTAPYNGGGGGGCPYVSVWNGTQYVLDNNIIPEAEGSNGTDVVDYYLLQQPLIGDNGKYSLLVWDLNKYSFLDKVELLAVDHESDVNVAVTPSDEILTYKDPVAPVIALNKRGQDVSNLISTIDGNYYEGLAGDYLLLDFESLDVSRGAKLVLRTDILCEPKPCLESVHVQVLKADGEWVDVASFIPRVYWSTDIVDLSQYLSDINGDVKARLYFTANHKIDYVGLDTTKQGEFEQRYANLAKANHTRLGNVEKLVRDSDNLYVELLPGEQVILQFALPQNTKQERDYIIITEGHYNLPNQTKDAKTLSACTKEHSIKASENDPIVTVSSKLTLKGYAEAVAYALHPAGARAKYVFQIWLWVYDLTAESYVTQTLIDEKSEEAIAPGGFIPDIKSYSWDYGQDVISTFSATGGHTYNVYLGVRIQAVSATISIGGCGALVDFDSFDGYGEDKINGYVIVQYMSLSW